MAAQPDPQAAPPMSQSTATKVEVAKHYTRQYYQRMVDNPRDFIKEHSRTRPKRLSIADFELLTVIGRGAYGEVRLCHKKRDPQQTIYALKILRKDHMIRRRQVKHVHAEKNLMAAARGKLKRQGPQASAWIVELLSSFQDDDYLYFVMEYCPGGDLMWWLMKLDIFEIRVARFYIAELVEAVHALHKLNFAHRDLKPDNILLDRSGHIKLTDFGLCKEVPHFAPDGTPRTAESAAQGTGSSPPLSPAAGHDEPRPAYRDPMDALHAPAAGGPAAPSPQRGGPRPPRSREMFFTKVGSPGYMAPEVIEGRGYSMECDWWAVGIILYEMLCGYPPFNGDGGAHTAHKIIHWQQYLQFPEGVDAIDPVAQDLICKLLCHPSQRLSYDAIAAHAFFAGVDFRSIRSSVAPFKVTLRGNTDTSHFDDMSQNQGPPAHPNAVAGQPQGDARFLFYGFTTKFDVPAASSKMLTGNGSAGGRKRQAAPPIADFEGLS